MWWWWYIVSLVTKQCVEKKVECRVDVVVDGKIYRINEEEEEGK